MPIWSPNKSGSKPQRGFTLLEVILVMALVAVAFAFVAAAISRANPGVQLREHALRIANGLRHTKAQALRSQTPQRFVLDLRAHRWQAGTQKLQVVPGAIQLRMNTAVELTTQPEEGVVLFFPDGASSGGRITLSRGDQTWRADVNWITGEVSLQREAAP